MNRWIALKSILRIAWEVCRGRQPFSFLRYTLAEQISGLIFPEMRFSEYGRIFLEDQEFIRLYDSLVGSGNNHSYDRKYALDQLCKLALDVPGDTAECGSFRGASSHIICRKISGSGKKHHIFDSFQGLSSPGKDDGSWWEQGILSASEETVRQKDVVFASRARDGVEVRSDVEVLEFDTSPLTDQIGKLEAKNASEIRRLLVNDV